ncbi:hypothetical protein SK3146_05383 [Paenibacillus konkukensis]|uniref:Secreted protein n=1 Tax=Paenibacillus konkukensis TaxID=2020716 RepID=A0ABY4RUM0_9BACL|nr:hypothetical protein SK3146_05383 [Paenibacillus konkukensis]
MPTVPRLAGWCLSLISLCGQHEPRSIPKPPGRRLLRPGGFGVFMRRQSADGTRRSDRYIGLMPALSAMSGSDGSRCGKHPGWRRPLALCFILCPASSPALVLQHLQLPYRLLMDGLYAWRRFSRLDHSANEPLSHHLLHFPMSFACYKVMQLPRVGLQVI